MRQLVQCQQVELVRGERSTSLEWIARPSGCSSPENGRPRGAPGSVGHGPRDASIAEIDPSTRSACPLHRPRTSACASSHSALSNATASAAPGAASSVLRGLSGASSAPLPAPLAILSIRQCDAASCSNAWIEPGAPMARANRAACRAAALPSTAKRRSVRSARNGAASGVPIGCSRSWSAARATMACRSAAAASGSWVAGSGSQEESAGRSMEPGSKASSSSAAASASPSSASCPEPLPSSSASSGSAPTASCAARPASAPCA